MGRRLWLVTALALSIGVAAPPRAESKSRADAPEARAAKRTTSKRVAKRKKSKRVAKKRRSRKEASRTPNRRTASNMPRGWRWPPTKSMKAAGERCTQALTTAGLAWAESPREGKIVTPLVVASDDATARELAIAGITYRSKYRPPPYTMDCHLALALATHGPALYELGVRKVVFGSIFRFTKVRAHGKTKNALSRHALGLAMDVVAFEDESGAMHDVASDYNAGDELLRAVEDTLNGSGGFRTVLTPRNDPTSHHDHFHIEADVAYYDDEQHLVETPPAAAEGATEDVPGNAAQR